MKLHTTTRSHWMRVTLTLLATLAFVVTLVGTASASDDTTSPEPVPMHE